MSCCSDRVAPWVSDASYDDVLTQKQQVILLGFACIFYAEVNIKFRETFNSWWIFILFQGLLLFHSSQLLQLSQLGKQRTCWCAVPLHNGCPLTRRPAGWWFELRCHDLPFLGEGADGRVDKLVLVESFVERGLVGGGLLIKWSFHMHSNNKI